jgi:hypothetical protein
MVAATVVTSFGSGYPPGCTTEASGFSLAFGRALKDRVGSWDRWLGRLDYGIAAPFRQDVPGFTEVHLVGIFGGGAWTGARRYRPAAYGCTR